MSSSTSENRDAPVEVVPYRPEWPLQFEAERQLLAKALGPWLAGEIEHVGSTAVPGLAAKPLIDIMAPVQSLNAAVPAIDAARGLGYHHYPYLPDVMHWFCKPSPAVRTHHLHLVPLGSRRWQEALAFRDTLRQDRHVAQAYEDLKRELARVHRTDREAYTEGKAGFVAEVVARAMAGRIVGR